MSPDHLPLMGGVPDHQAYEKSYQDLHHGPDHQEFGSAIYHKSLYVCAGLGARGMLTAPYLTSLLVGLITGHTLGSYDPYSEKVLQALHPARFHIRQLIKKTL
jgi:glycine/D-amino acid oxidase-like deaminating enzyme